MRPEPMTNQCATPTQQMLWGPLSQTIMELETCHSRARQHHDEALLAEKYDEAKGLNERIKDLAKAIHILRPINEALR